MSTANKPPKPIIHTYREYNIGKFKTTKHYLFESVLNGTNQFTDKINVSKNMQCAKSMPDYWVKLREHNKWNKSCLTGLFKTGINLVYHGDQEVNGIKTHLILFRFSKDAMVLTVFFFKNFYTKDLKKVLPYLNQ